MGISAISVEPLRSCELAVPLMAMESSVAASHSSFSPGPGLPTIDNDIKTSPRGVKRLGPPAESITELKLRKKKDSGEADTNVQKFFASEPRGFNSPSAFGIYPMPPAAGQSSTIFSHTHKEAPTDGYHDTHRTGSSDSAAVAATFGLPTEAVLPTAHNLLIDPQNEPAHESDKAAPLQRPPVNVVEGRCNCVEGVNYPPRFRELRTGETAWLVTAEGNLFCPCCLRSRGSAPTVEAW
uniref:Uncharacterized protein n=1 Tax=Chromera velia CCMP2878 TaxID=1169474 RepID=A0A0G4H0M5_9ALVE|eukprot:Cvel_24226.t1-p1 / transcript=Cvel_24226.t1 / gene=Cvel_24226 / organism=Chromera_velia_CCMP2878 / gene_product=hypothetical protein / transcript_product=hypothetical protein / location=Cvel_scaffold2590:21647-22357(-) / protein_length=237 / sequence_SO=supercontig / SO=protein_coding / is_pseudo=false